MEATQDVDVLTAMRKHDFLCFCKYYLPHYFSLDFSPYVHYDFAEAVERARYESVYEGFKAPRDVAKTTMIAIAGSIYWIAHNRNEKIFVTQKTGDVAKLIRAIMYELDTNQRLIKDFGVFRPSNKQLPWSYSEGGVVEGAKDKKNMTISGCGVQGSSIGNRVTKAIIDDIHDPQNVATLGQRDKTIGWITEAILPTVVESGSVIFTNSSYHYDDMLNRYEKKHITLSWTDKFGQIHSRPLRIRTYDSIINEETQEVIWPQKNSYARLMSLKDLVTVSVFNRQYRNKVQSDETASFLMKDLAALKYPEMSYVEGKGFLKREDFHAIITSMDLAGQTNAQKAVKNDNDYYVFLTFGIRKSDGKRQLLNVQRFRGLRSSEVLKKVDFVHENFEPDLMVVESNQHQEFFADFLLDVKKYKVRPRKTDGTDRAHLRLKSSALHNAIERGQWILPYATDADKEMTDKIIDEFYNFGVDKHDDIVMAGYILERTMGDVQQAIYQAEMEKGEEQTETYDIPIDDYVNLSN